MLIIATDAGARSDVPAWVSQTGNELVESSEEGDVLKFYVRKK
jgi:TusA-related sulfurtransferase